MKRSLSRGFTEERKAFKIFPISAGRLPERRRDHFQGGSHKFYLI